MELVMVERSYDAPVSARELEGCIPTPASGLILQQGWVAADGRHSVHLYAAADLAAVERAQAAAELSGGRTWAGAWVAPSPMLDGPPSGFSLVVVQREFPAPVSEPEINAIKASARGCNEAHRVTSRDTFRSHCGRNIVCTFFAPDAESVRTAQRQNDIPFVRAWSASS